MASAYALEEAADICLRLLVCVAQCGRLEQNDAAMEGGGYGTTAQYRRPFLFGSVLSLVEK